MNRAFLMPNAAHVRRGARSWTLPIVLAFVAGSSVGAQVSAADPFDAQGTIAATWVMIWNGSTEKHWWKASDYHGCKVEVDGRWQAIDWNATAHIDAYCAGIRAAGIDAIVVDFTNGFRWEWQAKRVQQFCRDHGMKFAIAFHPRGAPEMEAACKTIWNVYASPDVPLAASYLQENGKPLAVLYTTRDGYARSVATDGEFRSKFATVWASGEDSDKDKWGWQLEPHVGPVPSTDAMFVTGAVKFDSPRTPPEAWRKSLSWLDHGFILARRSRPRHLIVGSYDDVHERNAWMVVDTADAAKGWQMRDRSGALRRDAYYTRVKEWLRGEPSVIPGGLIADGAYRLQASDGRIVGAVDERLAGVAASLRADGERVSDLVWFYHLGDNTYRIHKLSAALAMAAESSKVVLAWDDESDRQRWLLAKDGDGFRLVNKASGEALAHAGGEIVTQAAATGAVAQRWTLVLHAAVDRAADERRPRR
jgi:hypothetical protein